MFVPEWRRKPYQSGGVAQLYEEIRTVGYFAVLFNAQLLPREDRAVGNWVALYQPNDDKNPRHAHRVQRGLHTTWPVLWALGERHRIGVCGSGNGGSIAHHRQFEVNALGYRELHAFEKNVFEVWRTRSSDGWGSPTSKCVNCALPHDEHVGRKCLYEPTKYLPTAFEGYWWFPEHLTGADAELDAATLIRKYGDIFITW